MHLPDRLREGDTIGVVAPSRSFSLINEKWIENAQRFFSERGIGVRFSRHCLENWHENGGTIEQRVADLMEMFDDRRIKALITAIGGYNSNQLLEHLDYEVIRRNPKIFIGYSDITALNNAIHAKTGLVTFSGPHFSTLGEPFPFNYTIKYFDDLLLQAKRDIDVIESSDFAEDAWYVHTDNPQPRILQKNPGWRIHREGQAEGELVGGNIVTLCALIGTEYLPETEGKILFLEDCAETGAAEVDRALTQLRQTGILKRVCGLIVGRFPSATGFDERRTLDELLLRVTEEYDIPVISGVDFGHTEPMATLPIGIPCLMDAVQRRIRYLMPAVR